jgi:hypothetical protein
MPRRPPHPALDRLHRHPSTHRSSRQRYPPPHVPGPRYPRTIVQWEKYGLTPAQAQLAEQRLHLAHLRRPLTGPDVARRYGLRLAGILTAIRLGRVGNRRFGKQLHGHHGGNAVKRSRPEHLRRLPHLGRAAQERRRDAHRAQQEYDSRPAGAAPPLRSTQPWDNQGPGVVWNLDDLD